MGVPYTCLFGASAQFTLNYNFIAAHSSEACYVCVRYRTFPMFCVSVSNAIL